MEHLKTSRLHKFFIVLSTVTLNLSSISLNCYSPKEYVVLCLYPLDNDRFVRFQYLISYKYKYLQYLKNFLRSTPTEFFFKFIIHIFSFCDFLGEHKCRLQLYLYK